MRGWCVCRMGCMVGGACGGGPFVEHCIWVPALVGGLKNPCDGGCAFGILFGCLVGCAALGICIRLKLLYHPIRYTGFRLVVDVFCLINRSFRNDSGYREGMV